MEREGEVKEKNGMGRGGKEKNGMRSEVKEKDGRGMGGKGEEWKGKGR